MSGTIIDNSYVATRAIDEHYTSSFISVKLCKTQIVGVILHEARYDTASLHVDLM